MANARVVDPEAHDAYLRVRYWWSKRTFEGEWKGLDYFRKAVAKDPNYALAYAGIADSYLVLGHHGRLAPREALPKAKLAAINALELDPSLAEAHTSLATVKHSYDGIGPAPKANSSKLLPLIRTTPRLTIGTPII